MLNGLLNLPGIGAKLKAKCELYKQMRRRATDLGLSHQHNEEFEEQVT